MNRVVEIMFIYLCIVIQSLMSVIVDVLVRLQTPLQMPLTIVKTPIRIKQPVDSSGVSRIFHRLEMFERNLHNQLSFEKVCNY